MSRLTRYTQSLFGSGAGANQMAEFGSLAASAPALYSGATITPAIVQTLSNYASGWFAAVTGANSPAIEDMNSLCYLFAYQLSYLLQAGVAEWDSGTTYFTGDVVQNGSGVLFVSLTDSNLNNALTSVSNWQLYGNLTSGSHSSPNAVGTATPIPVSGAGNQNVYVKGSTVWTDETQATSNTWTSVVWSPALSLFCAVSNNGLVATQVMTSPDGVTWTSRTSSEADAWTSIAWSPELKLFAAVNSSGTNSIMTSPDGITWTSHAASDASSNAWSSVIWAETLGKFVAVAETGTNRVMTSTDGTTWTVHSAAEANPWTDVCWSPQLQKLVAVASTGTHQVMTSPDGTTWTAYTASRLAAWQTVTWSPQLSLFVAMSTDGYVMTSKDATFWTTTYTTIGTEFFFKLIWVDSLGVFVAVEGSSTNEIYYSYDGTTWKTQTFSGQAFLDARALTWSPDLSTFVIVTTTGTKRVCKLTVDSITANPQIAAGSSRGQRITLIGTNPLQGSIFLKPGTGLALRSNRYFGENSSQTFFWDDLQSLWIPVDAGTL